MTAYYNEIDPYAAQWLRNLIAEGHIAPGDVDERSIIDVQSADLRDYAQCHFFAGIGGWSIALHLAGWGDDRPVWTGSCPCQPFSYAGKQKAQADERHLWPAWFRLISEVHPPIIFGEQVAGALAYGWLDDAFDDLERENYETGAAVLPACSVGAPHKRDRVWFVGISNGAGRAQRQSTSEASRYRGSAVSAGGDATSLAVAKSQRRNGRSADTTRSSGRDGVENSGIASHPNSQPQNGPAIPRSECSHWLTEPAVGRVANGIHARAHKLRAYGNAIVPQVAAEFIKATM